jgi:hypothetical protein
MGFKASKTPSLSLPRKRERGLSRSASLMKTALCPLSREAGEGWGGGQ